MKLARICIAIAALLAFASVCSAQKDAPAADTESKLIANEKLIAEAVTKNDAAAFKNLVSQDGWIVNSHGSAKVSDVMQLIFDPNVKTESYQSEGHKVMMLDANTAILTYKTVWTGTAGGKTVSETSYDTTLWVKRDGKWWAMFHQSSEVPQTPAAAAPAESK